MKKVRETHHLFTHQPLNMDFVTGGRHSRNNWPKDTYPYKVFQAAMSAWLSKYCWEESYKMVRRGKDHEAMLAKFCAVLLAIVGIVQVCINIGLIGDMWDKNKRKRS